MSDRNHAPAAKADPRKECYEWLLSLLTALIICVSFFLLVVRVVDVSGDSMNPTLFNGNKMLVSGLFYSPQAGDVVVFKTDDYDPNKALVKRVIATEGQKVNIDFESGVVYVDDVALEESYVAAPTRNKLDFIGPFEVPEGCVFVMGDNRNASTDSRDSRIGAVDVREIIGRAFFVVFPTEEARVIK